MEPNKPITPEPDTFPKREKFRFSLERGDWVFAGLLFVFTLFSVIAGVWGAFQAGFSAGYLLLFVLYTVYLKKRGTHIGAYAAPCGVLAALFAAVFVTTTGTAIRFLSLCLLIVLCAVFFAALAGKPVPQGEPGLIERFFRVLGGLFERMPASIASLFSQQDPRVKRAAKAVLGVVCALPVLAIVVGLLIRSDAAFEGLMSRLVADVGVTAVQIIVSLIAFPFLLSLGFSLKKEPETKKEPAAHKGADTLFLSAFVGLLSAGYLVYLFSQLAYFFSAFSGILPADYTFSYAEYARRGFFELCGIAAINLSVLYAMLLLSRKKQEKLPVVLRVLGTFVDLVTLVLISTAMAKMALYIRQYGMTVKRLGTSACMVCMAVVFLALLLRFYLPRVRVLPVALIAASLAVLTLGAGNVHAFAAWYNYTAFESGKLNTIDTAYLRHLGDEGTPYLIRLTSCENESIRKEACGNLCLAVELRYDGEINEAGMPQPDGGYALMYLTPGEKTCGKLSQSSIPRRRAYAQMDAFLQANPDFLKAHAEDRAAVIDSDSFLF